MLRDVLSGNLDLVGFLLRFITLSLVVLICLPVHELAHGYAAYKLGDPTAKWNGRLRFNPLAHLDVVGAVMIFVLGIGYAKPVPINPRNFTKTSRKVGTVITAAAGPFSNLLVAFLSALVIGAVYKFAPHTDLWVTVVQAFAVLIQINVMLAVFNLIPIPPLDGSRIAAGVLPDRIYFKFFQYDRIIRNALMGFMLLAMILRRFNIDLFFPIHWVENYITNGFIDLAFLIFGVK